MDFSLISAHALAYLGDSVLECLIRERLILKGYEKAGKLNSEALNYVTAVNQAKAYANIESILTEKESDIFRRGKNSSHLNIPKSASPKEYKTATGFEAIFGYLKLCKSEERILELFNLAYPELNNI
ncbi:MAG: ribonuclease III [Clostridia bacterium]|nr:ribonuclease III [Clostridia bacterium]